MVGVDRQTDLTKVVHADGAIGGRPDVLNRRDEQARERRDKGEHDERL
jgi:hypothetical protein